MGGCDFENEVWDVILALSPLAWALPLARGASHLRGPVPTPRLGLELSMKIRTLLLALAVLASTACRGRSGDTGAAAQGDTGAAVASAGDTGSAR
jgi:hypothetical protein